MRALRILAVVATAAAAAGALWWRAAARDETVPLDRDWSAVVTVIAGDGVAEPLDGEAYRARFVDPFGVAVAPDGTVYVADGVGSHRIRALSPDGRVTTVAGGDRGFADGSGPSARFDTPSALAVGPDGTLYVADTGNNAIRRITPDAVVSTVAGDGIAGFQDGPAREARFNGPIGVAVDSSGRVFVADTYNDRVRVVEPDAGTVRTLVPEAQFDTPSGIAVDAAGRVYVADTRNRVIQQIDASGSWVMPFGLAALARPIGIAVAADGDVYVSDERGSIWSIHPDGVSRIVAGSIPGFRDGAGLDARFRRPSGVAVAGPGRLIVADAGNALLRLVAAPSRIEFRAPPAPAIDPQFDVEAFRALPLVWPVAPVEGPHEIAGTVGEARGDGAERLHLGVDVRAEQGTVVHAVRDGAAASPTSLEAFGTLSETIAIGPITYIHVRAGRGRSSSAIDLSRFVATYDDTGKLKDLRVRRGARFAAGDAVGTVNPFNHVHLNIGWSGEEYNPLSFRLPQFEDSVSPVIAPRGIQLLDEAQQPIKERVGRRVVARGEVQIVVDAWDQSNESRPGRRLGLYDLGYQVLNPDGTPTPGFETIRHTMRFDRFTIDPEAARLVYATGSGIPFYGNRRTRFLYLVTNTLRDGVAARGVWDTTLLPPGDYVLRIWAADINGNVATANRDLPVTIQRPIVE
jgi:sugar lactone lactonase YvrE